MCQSQSCVVVQVLSTVLLLQSIEEGLVEKNHQIQHLSSSGAVVQAVVRYDKGLHAESDPRKWAYAAGY